MKLNVLILAAGQGTRMKSKLPKVLHQVVGKPMVWYALRSAANLSSQKPVVVVGNGAEQVREALGEDAAEYVLQTERLGTGHAVKQAEQTLRGKGDLVLVINGDLPLLREETLERLVALQRDGGGVFSMATVESDHPRGFGRVVLAADGTVSAIVEEADCTPAQREIRVLNVGVYCFSAEWLWGALRQLELSPKGEYYLTDLVKIAAAEGNKVLGLPVDDANEAAGVNTRVHLAEVEALMRERINTGWMLEGVTMTHPAQTYIEPTVKIGADTVIHPNCWLRGSTTIGEDCEIGPNTIITDSSVGNRTKILSSVLEMAVVENDVDMGPFARLRKGAHLADHVHMGNFGEVKNSYLSPGVKMGHFSYIGDAQVGVDVNIGCGTVTCNYDGKNKNKTEIGDYTFIGSGTMLVAPLKIGEHSYTGAGSVVTHDVPSDTTVVGVPARVHHRNKKSEDFE